MSSLSAWLITAELLFFRYVAAWPCALDSVWQYGGVQKPPQWTVVLRDAVSNVLL